uniref:Family with sequence similarity 162 member B n=1 Tax=Sphenodon punctatus TaxID=8508 RepID=A0A8D0LAQ7_SPHPU
MLAAVGTRVRLHLGRLLTERHQKVILNQTRSPGDTHSGKVGWGEGGTPRNPSSKGGHTEKMHKVPGGRRPSSFDKKILLWTGRFKTEKDIPLNIMPEMLNAARNKARIKTCYIMIVATVIACFIIITLSKRVGMVSSRLSLKAARREEDCGSAACRAAPHGWF